MPLLPEGVELYKSLAGQPAISKRTVEDLRNNLLSQKEPNWGTVSPDSLKVQLLAEPCLLVGSRSLLVAFNPVLWDAQPHNGLCRSLHELKHGTCCTKPSALSLHGKRLP